MSFTHTITHKTSYNDNHATITKELVDSQIAGEEHNISESIADGASNQLVAYTLDFSQAKTFIMWATAVMTVKTNSSTVPDQTFTLAANTPIAWSNGQSGITNPIDTDITALYVTNSSGAAGVLNVRSLQDPTV